MSLLDLFLILILLGFAWFGFWFGLIHAIGGLVGVVVGSWLAGHFTPAVAEWLAQYIHISPGLLKLLVFIGIFILVNRIVGFGFFLIDKTLSFVIRIPFIKTIDRLAGAAIGLLEGALVLGLVLYYAERLPLPVGLLEAIAVSDVAARLVAFASILVPLLPKIIRYAQPYVPVELPK